LLPDYISPFANKRGGTFHLFGNCFSGTFFAL